MGGPFWGSNQNREDELIAQTLLECRWCRRERHLRQRYCSRKCRQAAFRSRKLAVVQDLSDTPKKLAYADPPYPGCAFKYYGKEPSYGGEVDHGKLLSSLATNYDGWALSTASRSLGLVLSLAAAAYGDTPRKLYVCPWVKTHHHPRARGPSNIHEFLIVAPARLLLPGVPDALVSSVARGGGSTLMGRKPIKFVMWMFALLGAAGDDTLDDLFPGSGVVGRCWEQFKRSGRPLVDQNDD